MGSIGMTKTGRQGLPPPPPLPSPMRQVQIFSTNSVIVVIATTAQSNHLVGYKNNQMDQYQTVHDHWSLTRTWFRNHAIIIVG